MSHFIQTNNVIIQPPAYLQGNKTSLLTYGANDFEIGKTAVLRLFLQMTKLNQTNH